MPVNCVGEVMTAIRESPRVSRKEALRGASGGYFRRRDSRSLPNSVHLEREILQFPVTFDLEDDRIARFERADDRL